MAAVDMLEEIRALCACPSRLPCSDGERQAHEHVAARLRDLGLEPTVEPFRFTTNTYAQFAVHTGLLSAAGLLGLAVPAAGAAASTAVTASFYGDLQSRWFWLRRLLPHGESRNVVARVPAAGPSTRRVILMAHVDAAREGPDLVYEPTHAKKILHACRRLGVTLPATQSLFAIGALQSALLGAAAVGAPVRGLTLPLIGLSAFTSVNMARAATKPAVPGANDNASGVAVLLAIAEELRARPLPATEVWLVATGCEEAALGGAISFFRQHEGELDRARTFCLALDSVGAGAVRYATGEGLAHRVRHDRRLLSLAEATGGAAPYAMPFCTDALAASVRGYPAISLICLDEDDYPANYHWRTDEPSGIQPEALAATRDFTLRFLAGLDSLTIG